ncbi:hypothetical protein ACLB2K_064964 [Fragaria x ananassa]
MAAARVERGDPWKTNALSVQRQLRERFRVEVDRRFRRHPIFADSYFASTVQRWLQRFRDFKRDSLPSSTAFYRKRVGKEINAEEESAILRMVQAVAVPVIGNVCHVFMNGLNRVQVYGLEKLHDALLCRPKDRPLLTVSNHVASMDDPLVVAALLPPNVLLDAKNLRWTLCASDRCFSNPVTSAFFRSVKVLPVSRGEGIYQKGMDIAISKLNQGGWVHIFPEGSRSRDGGKTLGSSKRGVGRLVLDADNIPMVVPFVHSGMQDIMPIGASFPRIGKTVTVVIGDPIYFDDLLNNEGAKHLSRGKLYDAVSSRIGHRLHQLKVQVDKLAQGIPLLNDGLLMEETPEQLAVASTQEPRSLDRFRAGFSKDGWIASRMRTLMEPTELMGFAARGLFMNRRAVETSESGSRRVGPLKAWNQFLEANVLPRWNYA